MPEPTRSAEPGVLGATGHQGGAVVTALLDRERSVRALVRDESGGDVERLRAAGAKVTRADTDDPASLPGAFDALAGTPSENRRL